MSTNHKSPCVITIGNFDGVHKGHIALINTAISFAHENEYRRQFLNEHKELATCYTALQKKSSRTAENLSNSDSSQNMEARIITFSPHPAYILSSKPFTPLMNDSTRLLFLEQLGADHIDVVPFDQYFAKQSGEDFCIKMIQDYNMKMLFIGYDFKMGSDKVDIQTLEKLGEKHGFCVHALLPIRIENMQSPSNQDSANQDSTNKNTASTPNSANQDSTNKNTASTQNATNQNTTSTPLIISSTHIRKSLLNGEIELATQMLGKYFHISGIVEHGAKRGGDLLGFPTANLKAEATVVPRNGVYATLCKILIPKYKDHIFLGVTNIGHNPTFGEFAKSIETYILDFNDNLYDLPMEISFVRFIRDEVKFNSVDELIKQITADTNNARVHLNAL